jgi:hypothetical protein
MLFVLSPKTLNAQNLENLDLNKPVKISGAVNLEGNYSELSNNNNNNNTPEYAYSINSSVNLNILNIIDIPVSVYITNKENNLNIPDLSTFGVSPKYKWVTIHAGYQSLTFSDYSLNGVRILGGGMEINPDKKPLAAKFFIGKMDLKNSGIKLNSDTLFRNAFASQINYNKKNSNLNFVIFKAIDRKNFDTVNDFQKENLVLGLNYDVNIKKIVEVKIGVHRSNYIPDIHNQQKDNGKYFFKNKTGSYNANVYNINCSMNKNKYSLGINYNRIDPGYKSLGTYYIDDDRQNITLKGSTLLVNKITVIGTVGIENNNLHNNRLTEKLKKISSIELNSEVLKTITTSIKYSNYATNHSPTAISFNDTLNYGQTTKQFYINTNITKNNNSGNVSYNYQNVSILNESGTSVMENNNFLHGCSINFIRRFHKNNASISLSFNNSKYKHNLSKPNITNSYIISANKSFKDPEIIINLSERISYQTMGNDKSTINNLMVGIIYSIKEKHSIGLRTSFLSLSKDELKNNEFRLTISYNYVF